jgi:hypothetical protein
MIEQWLYPFNVLQTVSASEERSRNLVHECNQMMEFLIVENATLAENAKNATEAAEEAAIVIKECGDKIQELR